MIPGVAGSLRQVFERITAEHVLERIHSTDATTEISVAVARMRENDFDVLGVRDKRGGLYGYVKVDSEPSGTCAEHASVFHPYELIANSAPLEEVLAHLRLVPYVFVLGGTEVYGIITRADLQKAPVRIFVFGLITIMEMQLTKLVREYYPNDAWTGVLGPRRTNAARRLLTERRSRNEEIDLTDCLQFCDKRDLLLRNTDIREFLDLRSKAEGGRFFRQLEALRNRVAHGQDLVSGSSWRDTIDLVEQLDLLLAEIKSDDAPRRSQ
jgi:hypothetical protein